ncbi:MAG: thermopsin family protease [Thermoplasmata archaeon]
MTQGKRVMWVAIALMAVMVFSSLAAVTSAVPAHSATASSAVSVSLSTGAPTASAPANTGAAAALESEIASNSARYASIAQSLESKGVKPGMIYLPSSDPAGYINGQLVPGPEYALDTEAPITAGYSAPPAPSGIAYYGQSGSDVSGAKVATVLDTSSLEGSLNVQNLSTLYLDTDNPDQWGGQLNAVLLNLSLEGVDAISSDPIAIWAQNVVSYQSLTDTLTLVDNTWNFTSTSESFPASGTGTVVANDTSDINYGGELYIGAGPTFYAPAPYSVQMYLNTSLYNPFICTSDSSVASSSTCSNPATGTADYKGDQTLFYNYTFSDSVTHQQASGTFDWLTFHSGKSSLFDPSNTRVAGFEASGGKKGTIGILNDWELDFGIGAYDGANQNVLSANGTANLYYVPDCTKATSSTPSTCTPTPSPTYSSVPAALNFGSQTGECGIGMNIGFYGTTATFNAGPFNLHALWGYSSQAGISAGAVAVTNAVQVSGSPLTLSAQPYIFVFFEDTSVATPTATYSWAPDVPTWYLMPGTYKWEAMLSDYTEQTGTITITAGTPFTLSATLPYATSNGVYTPLWAFSNAQLAGISSSGSGTVGSQYTLFNNPTSGTGNPLNTIFNTKDDYDFPSYAGVLLSGTTAYVNVHSEVTFYVGSTGLYLQNQLYRTEYVTVSNAADINGWEDMESLIGSVAAQNPIPQANLMIWDSTHDLVYDNNFVAIKAASSYISPDLLMFYGGTGNVVWGNTFNDPSTATKATPGTYAGIAEAENGDLIYNNNFQVDNPVPFMVWDPYTEIGPVAYHDTWNISEESAAASSTVNGFSLTGSILGAQPFQGGNEYWNYGNSLNPATTTPFTNVVDYTSYASIFPPGYGADEHGMTSGGDYVALPGFTLTFTESGLPGGTSWHVTILGVTESSTTATVTFTEVPNGAYAYGIGAVPGYHTTSTGTATVDGAAHSVPIVFAQTTYTASFTESGLPSGTSWSVTLNSNEQSATGTSIGFSEANGTFSYTVSPVAGYQASPTSGSVTVNGASVSVGVTFTPVTYTISFSESGLPSGETFQVMLNGVPESTLTDGGTDTLAFTDANGTYSYTIASISGWTQATLPFSGMLTVDGTAVTEPTLAYTQVTYSVTFSESGLPATTPWSITLNGNPESSMESSILFSEPNGTFGYTVGGVAGFAPAVPSGSLTVNGADVSVSVVFTQVTYSVVFSESGVPSGETFSVTLNGTTQSLTTDGATDSLSFVVPNGSYAYSIAEIAGYTQSTLPSSGSVTVSGATVIEPTLVYSQVSYAVTFSESGLALGTMWSVTLNGNTISTEGTFIEFTEPNGTFSYTIGDVAGYSAIPNSGSLTVNGGSTSVAIDFATVTYIVTFSESGLASGETFQVTVNGDTEQLTTNGGTDSLAFTLANGTYSYTITGVTGYYQSILPYGGMVTVNGASVTEPTLVFSQVTYSVTFTESGLPGGTSWSVTLNGDTLTSTGATIVFAEPNGTYGYHVDLVPGYGPTPSSGSVLVNGAPESVAIAFTAGLYPVTFYETGLPGGTSWSVRIGATTLSSTGSSIEFMLPNGTYTYYVGPVPGYQAIYTPGSVTVHGAAANIGVTYLEVTYDVLFTETGLPAGKTWTLVFDGTTATTLAGREFIVLDVPNGTYDYLIHSNGAFRVTGLAPEGTITVNGASVSKSVTFVHGATYSITFKETGLAAGTHWCVSGIGCSSTAKIVLAHLTPGTYSYSVRSIGTFTTLVTLSGVSVSASGSTALVHGETFQVKFSSKVTFTESGLPASTSWSVTSSGQTVTSTTTMVVLYLTNGTHSYTVHHVAGYTAAPGSGRIAVAGVAIGVSVTFTASGHPHSPAVSALAVEQRPWVRAIDIARAL